MDTEWATYCTKRCNLTSSNLPVFALECSAFIFHCIKVHLIGETAAQKSLTLRKHCGISAGGQSKTYTRPKVKGMDILNILPVHPSNALIIHLWNNSVLFIPLCVCTMETTRQKQHFISLKTCSRRFPQNTCDISFSSRYRNNARKWLCMIMIKVKKLVNVFECKEKRLCERAAVVSVGFSQIEPSQ